MMDDNKNYDELRGYIAGEVLFTNEAAKQLGISTQRLHQLVQSGKLVPIKQNRAGSLFLRRDIEARKFDLANLDLGNNIGKGTLPNDPMVLQEAINYFTIQSVCGWSGKRTQPIYDKANAHLNLSQPITENLDTASLILDFDAARIQKSYAEVAKGFVSLPDDTYVIKRGQDLYPGLLLLTNEAPEFLFMRGNINLAHLNCIAVVGTRNPTEEGRNKAFKLATLLGKYKIVVASGLAKGIDRSAHEGALEHKTPTIAVIGTPITKSYPKEHAKFQEQIAESGLLISQFAPSQPVQRWNFPMRNAVMSGISLATVVVEAGETSGALFQADYALKQDRFVFVPQGAVDNPSLKWPRKYVQEKGAFAFSRIEELINKLQESKVSQLLTTYANA